MRCPAKVTAEHARELGQPDGYAPQCGLDAGHEGNHMLIWIVPGSGNRGRVAEAAFPFEEQR